jgi:FdhE protein
LNKSLIKRKAKQYIERNPKLKEVIELYRDIYSVQRRVSKLVPDKLPHIEGGQISYRIDQGRLLIEPDELDVDLSILKNVMREVAEVLSERSEESVEGLDGFAEELEDEERLEKLVESFKTRDEEELSRLIQEYSLDPTLVYLVLHTSMAPFYWSTAGTLARKAVLDQVPRGECPVCGDLPVMGFLRSEDGLRVLECSLCGSRWGVPRMMCPYCKNMDQKKLSYIFAEEDPRHRAYLCDKCNRYLKITAAFDELSGDIVIPLEDLATVHMDHAAEEKGYERGCRTVFS